MATVAMTIQNDSILVMGSVNNKDVLFIIDTGDAVGPVFNIKDAQVLDLPKGAPLNVSGAGGQVQIYATEANISLGGLVFEKEQGAVDVNLEGPSLLGLPFFIKQGGVLAFDFQHGTLTTGTAHVARHHQRLDGLLEEWLKFDHATTGDAITNDSPVGE